MHLKPNRNLLRLHLWLVRQLHLTRFWAIDYATTVEISQEEFPEFNGKPCPPSVVWTGYTRHIAPKSGSIRVVSYAVVHYHNSPELLQLDDRQYGIRVLKDLEFLISEDDRIRKEKKILKRRMIQQGIDIRRIAERRKIRDATKSRYSEITDEDQYGELMMNGVIHPPEKSATIYEQVRNYASMESSGASDRDYDLAASNTARRAHGHRQKLHGHSGAEARPAAVPQSPESGAGPDPCLLYTSPSPRDLSTSRMPSSA